MSTSASTIGACLSLGNEFDAIKIESGTAQLLILSQVILSIQLSFAVIPLVMFTSSKTKMGEFQNPRWVTAAGWTLALVIALLNLFLLWQQFSGSAPA
ncbi:MAG: divalent metal cation transporter [Verrucomicrobia bacterium]|nr:divalent metal cation transporter [Verrucomicrobiota bacterium]